MKALKKYRGPGKGKRPVLRNMIVIMEGLLNPQDSLDDLVLWAAILGSWHFMMRSSEYCAKLARGAFDTDRVIRVCDVTFFIKGRKTTDYARADEVQICFGKTKMTSGGEVRSHFAADHHLCVVRVLAALFLRRPLKDKRAPLFSWAKGSTRPGSGVRYADILKIIKAAAVAAGKDPTEYASHSMRKGGASQYLLSGNCTLEEVRIMGRWKSFKAMGVYIDEAAKDLTRGKQWSVCRGATHKSVLLRRPPRERDFMRWKARKQATKLKAQAASR